MIQHTKRMTTITMLLAISIVFHIVESMIPIPIPIPGFKLGLANIVGLIGLYMFDAKVMISINFLRVILASLLRGMLFSTSFFLSLFGVALATIFSIICYKKSKCSIFGVSIVGSVFHSIGQVIAITFIYQQFFMQIMLPILMFLGILTGISIAFIAKQVLKSMRVI